LFHLKSNINSAFKCFCILAPILDKIMDFKLHRINYSYTQKMTAENEFGLSLDEGKIV
jgi:hypothetical protein